MTWPTKITFFILNGLDAIGHGIDYTITAIGDVGSTVIDWTVDTVEDVGEALEGTWDTINPFNWGW